MTSSWLYSRSGSKESRASSFCWALYFGTYHFKALTIWNEFDAKVLTLTGKWSYSYPFDGKITPFFLKCPSLQPMTRVIHSSQWQVAEEAGEGHLPSKSHPPDLPWLFIRGQVPSWPCLEWSSPTHSPLHSASDCAPERAECQVRNLRREESVCLASYFAEIILNCASEVQTVRACVFSLQRSC